MIIGVEIPAWAIDYAVFAFVQVGWITAITAAVGASLASLAIKDTVNAIKGTWPWELSAEEHLGRAASLIPFVGGLAEAGIKKAGGNEVSGMDWGMAGLSAVTSVIPLAGAGELGKVAKTAVDAGKAVAAPVSDAISAVGGVVKDAASPITNALSNAGTVAQMSGAANLPIDLASKGAQTSSIVADAAQHVAELGDMPSSVKSVIEGARAVTEPIGNAISAITAPIGNNIVAPVTKQFSSAINSALGPKFGGMVRQTAGNVLSGAAKGAVASAIGDRDVGMGSISGAAGGALRGGIQLGRSSLSDEIGNDNYRGPGRRSILDNDNYKNKPLGRAFDELQEAPDQVAPSLQTVMERRLIEKPDPSPYGSMYGNQQMGSRYRPGIRTLPGRFVPPSFSFNRTKGGF